MRLILASEINFDLQANHRVIGYYIYDDQEKEISDVRDLLVDKESRRPRYLVIEIGGLMGIKGKRILIPYNAAKRGGIGRLDIYWPEEHVIEAPIPFDYSEPTEVEEESIHRFFNVDPYWFENDEISVETNKSEVDASKIVLPDNLELENDEKE